MACLALRSCHDWARTQPTMPGGARSATLGAEVPRTWEGAIDAIVVYESVYGNTREVVEAIAEGVAATAVRPIHEAQGRQGTVDVLIVGGPTHVHGMATKRSRHAGADKAARRDVITSILWFIVWLICQ